MESVPGEVPALTVGLPGTVSDAHRRSCLAIALIDKRKWQEEIKYLCVFFIFERKGKLNWLCNAFSVAWLKWSSG